MLRPARLSSPQVVGSELIQKYLGDGPKLVRELFRIADEQAPTIVFMDEIDAVRAPPQHGLSSNRMARITSDCGKMCSMCIKWP